MIPYIYAPDLKIGPLTLHPFGLLVATGVILGTWLATWRARKRGIDLEKLNSFITWMLIAGFLGGHMLDEIFYHPQEVVKRPWSLFLLWEGLSSFGGFLGALVGIVLWKYFEAIPVWRTPIVTIAKFRRRGATLPILPFADLILSVFPVAWVFGRSGCSVVHDHPGIRVVGPETLSVGYPSDVQLEALKKAEKLAVLWDGPIHRFDLGLIELLFTVVVAAAFALTWRRKLTAGAYVAAVALSYGPVRFAMDFLRIRDTESADPRYGALTPAQWACLALVAFGLVMVVVVRRIRASGKDPLDLLLAPKPLPEGEGSGEGHREPA